MSDTEFDKIVAATQVEGSIAVWTDAKRKDYVKLFHQRANVAIYLLRRTSYELAREANEKHFLGTPKFNELAEKIGHSNWSRGRNSSHNQTQEELGRDTADLEILVKERVKTLIKQLPALNKAMEILDPDTANKMIKRDQLQQECQELVDEFNEISEDIVLADLPQDMTIGEFRTKVKDLETKRKGMLDTINAKGKEGQDLEKQINKTLYRGMPGISDEIMDASYQLYQNSVALDQTKRRVEEQVLYGDNDAALAMLQTFSNDELKLNDAVAEKFSKGLESLKAALKGKKKNKPAPAAPATEPVKE